MSERHRQDSAGMYLRRKILGGQVITNCLYCPHGEGRLCSKFNLVIEWPATGPIPEGCGLENEGEEVMKMSYSVNKKCHLCAMAMCADGIILSKAVELIHSLPTSWSPQTNATSSVGHLGGGSIDLNCSNYKPKDQPAQNSEAAHP